MHRYGPLLSLLLVLLSVPGTAAQTEIPGTVTAVDGRKVTIQIPGDLLPRTGDEVRLRFRDPVPGAGLVFLEGTWEVSVVRRDEVEAAPGDQAAEPQEGLVAVILSEDPQSKEAFTPEPEPEPEEMAPRPEEPAVAARVRDRDDSDVEKIDRRRYFTISAGASLVGFQSPAFLDYEPDAEVGPRLTAAAGLNLLPNLAVSGHLGVLSVNGTSPDEARTQSAQEIYKALGATLYFSTPGNVPGDLTPFVQGGYAWYDVHYGGADSSPEVTGTGVFGGGGLLFTIRRGFGLFVAGQVLQASYDEEGTVLERSPAELNAGATVIF